MALSVVILAAGQGTRMRSGKPKVLHEISGKPMLFHVIDAARVISDDITVVVSHRAEHIQESVTAHYNDITFHHQDMAHYPGTGGAVRGVTTRHGKTLILNGDMPLVTAESLTSLAQGDADINMGVITLDDPSGYGRVVIIDGHVREIVEEKDCIPAQKQIKTVNAGVYCVTKELLECYIPQLGNNNAQAEYYLTDIIQMAVKEGKQVDPILVEEEAFKGVNSKYDLSKAESIMQCRIKEALMHAGVIMRLPETIYIDCRASFSGECMLENGVTIQGECRITDSHIKAHTIIENAAVVRSTVGPLARIRPQSILEETQIGNFVEVKKSHLCGVKAGHLSYLGDCEIGEGSNIGAGTITCNYDGKAKHKTIIGKNVFVGSDTQLVAPVTVEDDTIIAAGSTITKDVPSGALATSRTPQKIVKGFFAKFFGAGK